MTIVAPPADLTAGDRNLPRYVGYPPAPQFGLAVGAAQHDDWLAALPRRARLAVQVHVPFCEKLCWFCSCRTQGVSSEGPVADYVAALKAEIDRVAARTPPDVVTEAVSWVGGSPTILSAAATRDLAAHLAAALPPAPDLRFSVQVDGNGVEPDRLDALLDGGMTEASIGLQDFDPSVQEAIGRVRAPERVAETVAALRRRGVRSVAVDLLYGLPRQTPESFAATLEIVVALAPERVSLTGYAHVPWMAKRQRMIPEASLPEPPARAALFRAGAARLLAAGYVRCGVDLFALPDDPLAQAARAGRLRRDLAGYAAGPVDAVLGFGAASISRLPQGYVQNAAETGLYQTLVAAGRAATARGVALSLEDRVRGRAIEMLLCDLAFDRARLVAEFGDFARLADASAAAARAAFPGRLRPTADGFALCDDGPLLARQVARCFDAYAAEPAEPGRAPAV